MSDSTDLGQLEALFIEVSSLAVRLRGGIAPTGREEGFTGGVSGVLQALGADGPHTVPGVARERRTSRQNIQFVVNRLKKAGLVDIENNPAHKRSSLVRLTESGKAALGRIQVAESGRLESLLAQIPEEDVACTRRVLSQIRHSLGGHAGNETGQQQANLQRSRSPREAKANVRRRRLPAAPAVERPEPEEEEFPLSLL